MAVQRWKSFSYMDFWVHAWGISFLCSRGSWNFLRYKLGGGNSNIFGIFTPILVNDFPKKSLGEILVWLLTKLLSKLTKIMKPEHAPLSGPSSEFKVPESILVVDG